MDRANMVSIVLMVLGVVSGLGTISAGVTNSNVDWLATVFLVVISGGFGATGALWITQKSRYDQIPAFTLVVLGVCFIIGGFTSFHPFQSTQGQGLHILLTSLLVLTGIGLAFGGWRWVREHQMHYPLGLLSGGLVLGIEYIIHQRFGFIDSLTVILLVVLFAALIAVAVVDRLNSLLARPN